MTNAERRDRRRDAGRKAAETRRARLAAQAPAESPTAPAPPETAEVLLREGRRTVLARARDLGREADLRREAWVRRYGWPKDWTADQVNELSRWLHGLGPTTATRRRPR